MSDQSIIVWFYVVGLFSTHGFLQDLEISPLVRIPVLILWPITVPFATVLGICLRAWEIWRS